MKKKLRHIIQIYSLKKYITCMTIGITALQNTETLNLLPENNPHPH